MMKTKIVSIIILIVSFICLKALEVDKAIPYKYGEIQFTDQDLQNISIKLGLKNAHEIESFLEHLKDFQYYYGLIDSVLFNDKLNPNDPIVEKKSEEADDLITKNATVMRKIARLIKYTARDKNLKSFSDALKSTKKSRANGVKMGLSYDNIDSFEAAFQITEQVFPQIEVYLTEIYRTFRPKKSKTEL